MFKEATGVYNEQSRWTASEGSMRDQEILEEGGGAGPSS